ncbi:MAG: Wzz/FepE/Etk N-terminal domain-containing protein [Cyclobacteriaceae bacterium]
MESIKQSNEEEYDVIGLAVHIWSEKRLILITATVVCLLGVFYALFSPVMYTSGAVLIPEKEGGGFNASGLLQKFGGLVGLGASSMASSSQGSLPSIMYPQVVRSNRFMKEVIHREIAFESLATSASIYEYYETHYSESLVETLGSLPLSTYLFFKNLFVKGQDNVNTKLSEIDFVLLTKEEKKIIESLNDKISISVDEITGVVSISVVLQDRLGVAELNKLVLDNLIQYLTEYRVYKAKNEVEFVKVEMGKAEKRYEEARIELARFVETHKSINSERLKIELENLTDQKDLTFELYKTLTAQYEQAKISLQKETPFFKVIQEITVPIEKSSPRRILIVVASVLLGLFLGCVIVLGKLLLNRQE